MTVQENLLATAAVSSEYLDFVYLNDSVYFLGLHEINKNSFRDLTKGRKNMAYFFDGAVIMILIVTSSDRIL